MTFVKRRAIAALLFLAAAQAPAQDAPQPRLRTVSLKAGMQVIHAELAITPAQQETGMMFRRTMGANEGMLFVNDAADMRCFWMHNTLLPLSIAFIADDGTIVNTAEMAAQTDDSHCSAKPVRYALEMNQGWFARHGLKPGARIGGGPFDR